MRKKFAKTDFTEAMLPKNRFQLFFDIYKNRFSLMINIGLLLFLFCAPTIAVSIITNLKVFDVNQYAANQSIDARQAALEIYYLTNSGNLMLIPCVIILAIGLSGVVGVLRRLIFQDGVLFWSDFAKSLKENCLTYGLTALLLGVMNYLFQYCLRGAYFDNGVGMQISVAACIIALFILAFISPLILVQSTLYNLKIWHKASNAFLLSMRMPHFALAMLATNVLPYLLLLIPNEYAYIILVIILPIIALPIQTLINMLICDSILDKFVNKQHYPQIYKKGMFNNADN